MSARTRVRLSGLIGLNDLTENDDNINGISAENEPEEFQLDPLDETEISPASDDEVIEEAVDNVDEVGEGLEALQEMIHATLATGGMSAQTAMFAQTAHKHICKDWIKPTVLGSLESFEISGGKMEATLEAFSAVTENLSKVWEKIKDLTNKYAESVTAFWNKYVSSAASLKRKALKLEQYIRFTEGKTELKKGKISVSPSEAINLIYKKNSVPGKFNDVLHGLTEAYNLVKVDETDGVKEADKFSEICRKFLASEHFEKGFKATSDGSNVGYEFHLEPFKAENFKKALSGVNPGSLDFIGIHTNQNKGYIYCNENLVGVKTLALELTYTTISNEKYVTSITPYLINIDHMFLTKYKELEPWTIDEIKTVTKVLAEAGDALLANKNNWLKRRNALKESEKVYDKAFNELKRYLGSQVKSDPTPEGKKDTKGTITFVKAMVRGFNHTSLSGIKIVNIYSKLLLIGGNAAYSFSVKSLNNLK